MTSTLLTRESMIREVFGELSMLMALPLPLIRKVRPLHFVIRIDWLISASISTGVEGESKFSMIHLLPSNSFFGGFFVRKLSGLGFLPGGAGECPLVDEVLSLRSGTTEVDRNDGFLCVICDGSTFFNPDVTFSPFWRSANTAPMSVAAAFGFGGGGRPPGGGGGGGGAAPPMPGSGGGGGAEVFAVTAVPTVEVDPFVESFVDVELVREANSAA